MQPRDITHFDSPAAFRAWLETHHAERDELWVGYWKKATGRPSLTWEESVDEALCFGWIDGIRRRVDDEAFTIRFTPRRKASKWSVRNLDRYAELETAGRIHPAGAAAYGRRREHPDAYSFEQETRVALSDEYLARLRENGAARANWQSRPPGYRRKVAHWVMIAKREETRERRLAALIEDLAGVGG